MGSNGVLGAAFSLRRARQFTTASYVLYPHATVTAQAAIPTVTCTYSGADERNLAINGQDHPLLPHDVVHRLLVS